MLRRLGHALAQSISILCLAGVIIAVPLGYLGMFLNQDGLVTLAAFLALPFLILVSILFIPVFLSLPGSLIALVWFGTTELLLPMVLRRKTD